MAGVLIRRGECHVMTEAEIGVRQLKPRNTSDCRPAPEAGRGQGGFYPVSWREHGLADTLVSDF